MTPAERCEVVIGARFRGPTGSGNGGWTAGRLALASGLEGPVQVTLRRPPPLERPLVVRDGRLLDGAELVALAVPGAPPPSAPAVDVATAREVEASYAGLARHPFPECFVCGPDRAPGDGMRLFPGRVGDGRTACTWTPEGAVDAAHVWAALDCPGGWTSDIVGRPMVLGRMTVERHATVTPGLTYVVTGSLLGNEGRKTSTVTSLRDPDGRLVASAAQTWIAVDPGRFG